MQVIGDFDVLSFVRIGLLSSIGHVNRTHWKRGLVFNYNPQGSRQR